jgi:DNA-binding CsgD family transcriptional regulator
VDTDDLTAARGAWARHDWQAAYDAASATKASDPAVDAERIDLLADAAWWLGRLDECIEGREEAYRIFDDVGEHRRAGQCAVWLYEHYCFKSRPAIAGGWLQRARRALDGDQESIEYGALILREAETAHGRGDLDAAAALADDAVQLGRRLRSTNLEAEALQTLGRVLIDLGDTTEGLAHLDEAMLFAVEGRLSAYATGKVYCSLIAACEELGDLRRAAEWTEATMQWAEEHPFAIFPGVCRVHRAVVLGWGGALVDAEREATQACVELIGIHVPNAAFAFAEVGDIRRRLGDLDGAEVAFAKSEELCGQSCAGLALLRVAQGQLDTAQKIIRRCVEEQSWNRLARAKLLPASAQIAVAAGDLDAADASVVELEGIASDFDIAALTASALSARGRVQIAERDGGAACVTLRDALVRWQELDVPYEVATTLTLLGQAQLATDDEDGAASSFAAAEALFDQIGVRLDARHLLATPGRRALPAGLTEREVEVLRLIAAGRTNKEIAADLYLSAKTVSRHLSNIFTKIGVTSRSAATAYAFENRLVNGRQ